MLHHHHPHRNRLSQPRTSPHDSQSQTPQALLESTAFASQLDEIDRLLCAFRLQRQRQSVTQWLPADEDTDEKLLDSESDGESGRRWSSSTESKGVGEGGGASADPIRLEGSGYLVGQVNTDQLGGTPVERATDQALGFGLMLPCSKPRLGDLASAPEGGGLWTERRPVVMDLQRILDDGAIPQMRTSREIDRSKSGTTTELVSRDSESGDGLHHHTCLETALGKTELAAVRRVTFDLPLNNEGV